MSAQVHASAALVGEAGVLLRGASGSGKSGALLALIAMAQRNGLFARLVGDDRLLLEARHGRLIARPHRLIAGQVERRGFGIEAQRFEPAAKISLVVDFEPDAAALARLPEPSELEALIETVLLPRLPLRAGMGREDGAAAILARLAAGR